MAVAPIEPDNGRVEFKLDAAGGGSLSKFPREDAGVAQLVRIGHAAANDFRARKTQRGLDADDLVGIDDLDIAAMVAHDPAPGRALPQIQSRSCRSAECPSADCHSEDRAPPAARQGCGANKARARQSGECCSSCRRALQKKSKAPAPLRRICA